ncbi:MAG: HAMP domain-containing sensor histidine kinase [Bacillota bacterium]|nr:HAMP domain-containing sensor histidine kinase [Bacillota bacterium]
MFRRTKIKFVSMYTLVFFVILCIFGISIYLFMYKYSYSSIDSNLNQKAENIIHNEQKEIPEENERESERRVSYLYWASSGKLVKYAPEKAFFKRDFAYFSPKNHKGKIRTQMIEGHSYRILTVKIPEIILHNRHVSIVQLVYNIDPEVAMLKMMLMMIGFGSIFGLLLSIFVGLFLANKALIPIQRSWEKQSQFVADASHELRTPLSVIQTHLELLFRHPTKTIEQESETIYKSLKEVKRVNKLVEELLMLARTDSNEQLINLRHFPIGHLLNEIYEQFEPIANLKDISLVEKIDKGLHFLGDQERLHQLFVILLDNALKYTAPQGKIIISCQRELNFIKIIIEDTGMGISEIDIPHIFDRFYRSEKDRSRTISGGTGLGLSIAKWIVEAHHGHITLESKLNVGTKFSIKFPVKEHH